MMKKFFITLIAIAILLSALGYSAWIWLNNYAKSPVTITESTLLTIAPGTGRAGLQKLLIDKKILSNTKPLLFLMKIRPELSKFKAGTYRIDPTFSVEKLLALLVSGKEFQFSITLVDGMTMKDWMTILARAPYLNHSLQTLNSEEQVEKLGITEYKNPEGWFYPDTYYYTAGTSDIVLLKRAHDRMKNSLDKIWRERTKDLPYRSAYELLIMASIIEKETGVESERTTVASVFINRIKKGMRLQTDPTVIYGLGKEYTGTLTRKDLTTKTNYNTYMINGLPPTPIAMPSIASLKAAANPANTPYYYFVATGHGGHTFTATLREHNQAVREYRKTLNR